MAIGVNWKEIWKPVWMQVWTQVPPEPGDDSEPKYPIALVVMARMGCR